MTGILLLAMERPLYGRMAFNTALCIKSLMPSLSIHLAYSGNALQSLNDIHLSFFDTKQQLDESTYMYDGKFKPFRTKSKIYDISPFDETLYLDADVAIFRNGKFQQFWQQDKKEIEIQTFNLINLSDGSKVIPTEHHTGLWLKYNLMASHYKIADKILPQMNSSFIYFRKSAMTKTFFDLTKILFNKPDAPAPPFRGEYPDEFFFQTAGAMLEIYPTETPFTPFYGEHETSFKGNHQLFNEYMGVMTYGKRTLNHTKSAYNDTIYNYHTANRRLKKTPIFYHEDKINAYQIS